MSSQNTAVIFSNFGSQKLHSTLKAGRQITDATCKTPQRGQQLPWYLTDVLLVGAEGGQTLPSFLPFIMLTPSSDTKKGDSSNTCWTWGKEGETGERKGDLSATRSKRKQWDGLNVIYCNGSSSRGALRLKGLIISPGGGLIKYHLSFKVPQGYPLLSYPLHKSLPH